MFTKEEIALAPKVIEAIKTIAETQGKECPECKGKGAVQRGASKWDLIRCGCKAGKVKGKWEWEPEIYDFVYYKNPDTKQEGVSVVSWIDEKFKNSCSKDSIVHYINVLEGGPAHSWPKEYLTPLLHWERIRKILKDFDYSFSIASGKDGGRTTVYKNVGTDEVYEKYHNNNLQLAVMKAVIELGKEK